MRSESPHQALLTGVQTCAGISPHLQPWKIIEESFNVLCTGNIKGSLRLLYTRSLIMRSTTQPVTIVVYYLPWLWRELFKAPILLLRELQACLFESGWGRGGKGHTVTGASGHDEVCAPGEFTQNPALGHHRTGLFLCFRA